MSRTNLDKIPPEQLQSERAASGEPRQWYVYHDQSFGTMHFSPLPVERDDLVLVNHLIEVSAYERASDKYLSCARKYFSVGKKLVQLEKLLDEMAGALECNNQMLMWQKRSDALAKYNAWKGGRK